MKWKDFFYFREESVFKKVIILKSLLSLQNWPAIHNIRAGYFFQKRISPSSFYHSILYFGACGICGGVFNILFLYFIGVSKINYTYNKKNYINLLIFMGSKCSLVQREVFTYHVKFLQNTGLTK